MGRPKGTTDARRRLVEASLRGFRGHGFGGVGVDALAREAGLTSGAFYAHFGSKAEAFRRSLAEGIGGLRGAIADFQARFGEDWLRHFVDFYLGELVDGPAAEGCIMPTLTGDVARADAPTRSDYREGVEAVLAQIADGLPGRDKQARASALLAVLTGASAIARALPAGPARDTFRDATRGQVMRVAEA